MLVGLAFELPVAALVRDLPLIMLSTGRGSQFAQGLSFIGERAQRMGCKVLAIGPDAALQADRHVVTAELPEPIQPFALCVPGQLLAEAHATALGLDPDSPLGLHKVTETV